MTLFVLAVFAVGTYYVLRFLTAIRVLGEPR